jgi:molecular chaperone DnaK
MPRATIDFGIDLGTTNSCIALWKGKEVEVIKTGEGFDCIPSAVWIDRKGVLHIGKRAKDRYEADPGNVAIEFKLQMGTRTERIFEDVGKRLKPEELSAEVLKELLLGARTRYSEEVEAAVITVPAAFELDQCNATRQAAELAGLVDSPLLQEPVAAALAYGAQSDSDKVYWLVYDLGGGTFDAALINLRDGIFRIVNHGGDNHLGGKLIDWEIVEQVLVPALLREYRLADFQRGNPKWRRAFAKLKQEGEAAKIRLSHVASTSLSVEFPDEKGETIVFDYELQRKDVERVIEPLYQRTLNICKRVLSEKKLAPDSIVKVLLVGGPTFTPYIRDRIADKKEGLGRPLDFSLDPMTVVARGAAIFAATQRFKSKKPTTVAPDQFALELEYKPVGVDPEPLVAGTVIPPAGQNVNGFTLQFHDPEAQPPWRSGKLRLGSNGKFMINLVANKDRQNTYAIELRDPSGRKCETVPQQLTYSVIGVEAGQPIMIHSLGVAQANNEVDVLVPKGASLPIRKKSVHRTVVGVRQGKVGELLCIPIVEGENTRRADRNPQVGSLAIIAEEINRDLPAGSEVEITIEVDPSRIVQTEAYIPILDKSFQKVIQLGKKAVDGKQLAEDLADEKGRLERVRQKVLSIRDTKALAELERIERERMEHDLDTALAASGADPDAADKCRQRLRDLKVAVDEVEDALEWPALLAEGEEERRKLREVVGQHGSSGDRQQMANLERETERAIAARDPDLLRRKLNEIRGLLFRVYQERPEFWIGLLHFIRERRSSMDNPALAEQLFSRAQRAIDGNDLAGLKAVVRQLMALLPPDQQQKLSGYGGGTVKSF